MKGLGVGGAVVAGQINVDADGRQRIRITLISEQPELEPARAVQHDDGRTFPRSTGGIAGEGDRPLAGRHVKLLGALCSKGARSREQGNAAAQEVSSADHMHESFRRAGPRLPGAAQAESAAPTAICR